MTTLLDYAVLSAAVYDDVRQGKNKIVLPSSWTQIGVVPSTLGFAAAAYQSGTDIVISYEGTDTDTTANTVEDWLGANLPAGVGIGSTQIIQAALFYEKIKADNPSADITFTGHSLGGGLASLMSVFFNRPATTFDEAPFLLSAINPVFIVALETALIANNFHDSSFNAFLAASSTGLILPALAPAALTALVATRESNVTTYDVGGEVLSYVRNALTAIYGGSDQSVPVGSSLLTSDPSIPAVTLHSIILLSALEISKTFQTDTLNLPNLLPAIFNSSLYYASPFQAEKQDFLTSLLDDQISLGYTNTNGLLSRFANDVGQLAQEGLVKNDQLNKALIAAAIEDYYFMGTSNRTNFFNTVSGGLSFDLSTINGLAVTDQLGYAKLRTYVQQAYNLQSSDPTLTALDATTKWYIQAGTANAMQATAGTENDVLLGGRGQNVLDGGGGNDVIFGGAGNDILKAEHGDSYLYGGAGNDTFYISDGGTKVISDTNPQHSNLFLNGTALTGIYIQSGVDWISTDGSITLSDANGWQITDTEGDTIDFNSFSSGDFGIELQSISTTTPGTPDNIITTPLYGNPNSTEYLGTDGNDLITTGNNRNNEIWLNGGDDTVIAGSGNDLIVGGFTVTGADRSGGPQGGNDIVNGGGGQDIIVLGDGDNRIYANTQTDLADAIAQASAGQPTGQPGDIIQIGRGNNTIVGGQGNDTIVLGDGNNLVILGPGDSNVGAGITGVNFTPDIGAGHINIIGGIRIDGAFEPAQTTGYYTPPADFQGNIDAAGNPVGAGNDTIIAGSGNQLITTSNGDNFIELGSGNSTVHAGAGDDVITGGAGNSNIYGAGGDDFIDAGSGNQYILGGAGDNEIFGGSGNSTIFSGSDGATWATSRTGNNYVEGGDGDTLIYGAGGSDTLIGGLGNDTIYAGAGTEYLDGGEGNNILVGRDGNDTLISGNGTDVLYGGIGNNLIIGGTGVDTFIVGTGNSTIVGGSGSNAYVLNPGFGNVEIDNALTTDILNFGAGISVSDLTVRATQAALMITTNSGGTVTVRSGAINLFAFADGSVLSLAQLLAQANTIVFSGRSGDTLIGGGGNDTLVGVGNNNTFVVNNLNDVVIAPAGSSGNTVYSSVSYTLPDNVQNLVLTGSAAITGTGNDAGGTITANDGNDTLVAGSGIVTLIGGAGNDSFIVNNASDVVVAQVNSGHDTIYSSANYYVLPQNVDNLTLTGTADLTAYGNDDGDVLSANSGNDTLIGGAGNDTLIAGTGNDILDGGAGDNTYVFNTGFGSDQITATSGTDNLQFGPGISATDLTVTAVLDAPALEIEVGGSSVVVSGGLDGMVGQVAFADGSTMSLKQLMATAHTVSADIAGPDGHLIFSASNGDSLVGGTGNDTIYGFGDHDTLTAGIADDLIIADGDHSLLVGGVGNDTLTALGAHDTLVGGVGYNRLNGTGGNESYILSEGGFAVIDNSSSVGSETLWLPNGMRFADFNAARSGDDLILQSNSGDTTALIQNFYSASSSSAATQWVLAGTQDAPQLLADWVAQQTMAPVDYQNTVTAAEHAFSLQLQASLVKRGQNGGTLGSLYDYSTFAGFPRANGLDYSFNGVTTQDVDVGNGTLVLGSSEAEQSTVITTQQTVHITTPVYTTEVIPGKSFIVPAGGSGFSFPDGSSVTELPDGSHRVDEPDIFKQVQTGTTTTTKTIPIYTDIVHRGFTIQNVTGDGGNDVITSSSPFVGSVNTGDGNVSVNLGTTSHNEDDVFAGAYGFPSGQSNPLGLGAFIQAGSGNDTLIGTDGNDVIVAGSGYDVMDGGRGADTYYVPLSGDSTDVIYDSGDPGGSAFTVHIYGGQLPMDTLVLPEGITPQDIQWRVFEDAAYPGRNVLQLNHGDANVLMVYSDSGDPSSAAGVGVEFFQFADGTVLTRNQLMAQGTPLANDFNPVVTGHDETLSPNQSVAASTLFTASDSGSNHFTRYEFMNAGDDGGYFSLSGQAQQAGTAIDIGALQLTNLDYVGGATNGSDAVQVRAFDGATWSAWVPVNVVTALAVPQIQAAAELTVQPYQVVSIADYFSVTAPANRAITQYQFQDAQNGAGFLTTTGNTLNQTLTVDAAQLAMVHYMGGPPGDDDTIRVRAFDGTNWSDWTMLDMSSATGNVVQGSGDNQAVTGGAGDQTLVSGGVNDTLIGGSGHDIFVANLGDGVDTIIDTVKPVPDVIQFGAGITANQTQITQQGADLLIEYDDTIVVKNFDPNGVYGRLLIDRLQFANGDYITYTNNGLGSSAQNNFAANGTLTGDRYIQSDGAGGYTSGSDIYNTDGSSSGEQTNPDGSYFTYTSGNQGNTTTLNFDAGGNETGYNLYTNDVLGNTMSIDYAANGTKLDDNWSLADGSYGSDTYNADGSSSGQTNNADGSSNTYTSDGHGNTTTLNFDTSGNELGYSTSTNDGQGNTTLTNYDPVGTRLSDSWTQADGSTGSDIFYADSGTRRSWTDPDGTHNIDIRSADGSASVSQFYADGSSKVDTYDPVTDIYGTTNTDTGGNWTHTDTHWGDNGSFDSTWSKSDGSHGSNGQNTATGETYDSSYTPGDGYLLARDRLPLANGATESKINYTYDSGAITSYDTITQADGSYTQTWMAADGSYGTNIQTADGGTRRSWTDPDGTHNIDIRSADGSASVSQFYADGSSKVDTYDPVTDIYGTTNTDTGGNWTHTDTHWGDNGSFDSTWSKSDGSHGSNGQNTATGETYDSSYTPGDGYLLARDRLPLANGATESKITFTYDSGAMIGYDTVTQSDGSYLQAWSNSDGTAGSVSVDSSGVTIGDSWVHADGTQGVNAAGNALRIGSANDDALSGNSGANLLIGGVGNDTLQLGSGSNLLAFDKGDGQDTVYATAGTDNALSLGGSFAYGDLALQKNGNDLILDVSSSDAITFKDWYASVANQNLVTLQAITAATSDYDPASSDVTVNAKVESFDFQQIVSEFDAAMATDPSLSAWSVSNALLDAHLAGSDTAALGGDLAYDYGTHGNLTGFNVATAQTIAANGNFVTAPQTLQPWNGGGVAQLR